LAALDLRAGVEQPIDCQHQEPSDQCSPWGQARWRAGVWRRHYLLGQRGLWCNFITVS